MCAFGLLAGVAVAGRWVTDSHQAWRLARYTETDRAATEKAVAHLKKALAAQQADSLTARAVPTLSQIEELAWQAGLVTRRAERAAATGKERRTTTQYTLAFGGPATE